MKNKPTVRRLITLWFRKLLAEKERVYLRYSKMADLEEWAQDTYGVYHNRDTYTREFRRIKSDYPWRFKDVSVSFESAEKTWLLLPKSEAEKKRETNQEKPAQLTFFKPDYDE